MHIPLHDDYLSAPSLTWSGIRLNLAAVLEDDLVRTFQPKWNSSSQGCLTEAAQLERAPDKTIQVLRRPIRRRLKQKRNHIGD